MEKIKKVQKSSDLNKILGEALVEVKSGKLPDTQLNILYCLQIGLIKIT